MRGADVVPLATVLDASVAVRWLVTENGSADAAALLARPTRWIAPRLMLTEVAGALHRKVSAGKLREVLASEALEELLGAVGAGEIRLAPDERVLVAAFALATLLQHRVPDCMYLALAEHEGAGLATADHALAGLARQRGIVTTLVGGPQA
jgi:predicted nucleic acid-binding protein